MWHPGSEVWFLFLHDGLYEPRRYGIVRRVGQQGLELRDGQRVPLTTWPMFSSRNEAEAYIRERPSPEAPTVSERVAKE